MTVRNLAGIGVANCIVPRLNQECADDTFKLVPRASLLIPGSLITKDFSPRLRAKFGLNLREAIAVLWS
jgi:hypothetical protein